MIIYGSYALAYWFEDYYKQPNDIDVVLYDDKLLDQDFLDNLKKQSNLPLEITKQDEGFFFDIFEDMTDNYFLTPEGLLTVKMSHAMYDYNITKTLDDIVFLQNKGISYNKEKLELLRIHWKKRYASLREKIDFNKSPDDFFNSAVTRYVNHDELHEYLKLTDIPAYKKIIVDDTTVNVSQEKFLNLSKQEQVYTFIEEIAVLACERYFTLADSKEAFINASQDFITRMTSGWYNIFLLENLREIFSFIENSEEYFNLMGKIMFWIRSKHNNVNVEINNI
jgi:hypothetical protein